MIILGDGPEVPAQVRGYKLYLPAVYAPTSAQVLMRALIDHPEQQREAMQPHDGLQRGAVWRATSMGTRDYFAHCDPDGICPNQVARANGCTLPADYGDGNSIESIAAGSSDANAILDALLQSKKHADHLLGRSEFYRRQTWYGCAMVEMPGATYRWYWSILIAPCKRRG